MSTFSAKIIVTISGNERLCSNCANDFFMGTYTIVNSAITGYEREWQKEGGYGFNKIVFGGNCWNIEDSEGSCAEHPVARSEQTDGSTDPWNLTWRACSGDTGEVLQNTTIKLSVPSIKIGSNFIGSIFLGSTQIIAAYLGNNKIYSRS